MAAIGRPEDPQANLANPPTGLPVQNQGGIPREPAAQQRTQIKPPITSVPAGPPGPEPQPLPIFGYVHDAMTKPATAAPKQPADPQRPVDPQQPIPRLTEHKLVNTLSSTPDEYDLESLGDGEAIATPFGEVFREPGGRIQMALNDMGKVKYEEKRLELRKRVGYVGVAHLANDPLAPQLEIIPGLPVYNPFAPTDRAWTE